MDIDPNMMQESLMELRERISVLESDVCREKKKEYVSKIP